MSAWDLDRPGNIKDWIAALNARRAGAPRAPVVPQPALPPCRTTIACSSIPRRRRDRSSLVLAAVSLDPYAPQEAILHVPLERLGIPEDETYQVHDVLSGERALWQGPHALVRLTPEKPAALWSVLRFRRTEQGFDYYF